MQITGEEMAGSGNPNRK